MIEAVHLFYEKFGDKGELHTFFAPGRVNLIGEHTDYNGGFVFPCALSIGTYAVARKRSDTKIRMYSNNFPHIGVIEFEVGQLKFESIHAWANYPKGVIYAFKQYQQQINQGFDVVYVGNIPNNAGLSSSASIELVTSVMLNDLFQLNMNMLKMIQLSQWAENQFVGVNCGIMDQFAIGMGRKNHAILLNCQSLEYTYSPLKLENLTLIIANTNKSRGLADSKYNDRRYQCEQALKDLNQALTAPTLGSISISEFESFKHLIENDLYRKRAKHAVYENERTKLAVQKLNNGDIEGFGLLMNESHISLRDDYEVSVKELDVLVEAAWEEGAIGARMTGAGFGGCTVNLIDKHHIDSFTQHVGKRYSGKTGRQASFYIVDIGDGARKIKTD
ncbi:galactokinase [Bacillus sp. CGMCC 1.16607]|uniref:galactokinase n=1 Tax=Bacillus sp. CGMCC 1.16607 TaxID=3351842 RepID=UPI003638C71E